MSGQPSTASILGRNLEQNADPVDSVNGHTYVEIDCYSMGETNRAASRAILSRRCQVSAAPCEGPTQMTMKSTFRALPCNKQQCTRIDSVSKPNYWCHDNT